MAHVQRAGGVGRHEFDQDLLAAAGRAAEVGALFGHGGDDGLAGRGGDAQVDEAGAGDLGAFDQAGRAGLRHQRVHDGLGQFARVAAGRLGQLHGHVGGDVAVGGDLGALQQHVGPGRIGGGVGQALRDGGLDQGDKLFLLLEEHGRLESSELVTDAPARGGADRMGRSACRWAGGRAHARFRGGAGPPVTGIP